MQIQSRGKSVPSIPASRGWPAEAVAVVARFRVAFRREPDALAYAPGRIELIGNHTDYNGGPVIGVAIDRGTWVAVAAREDGRACLSSTQTGAVAVEVPAIGAKLRRQTGGRAWANYPLGVVDALGAFDLRGPPGFDYLVTGDLPLGSGLSSSAAIEVASALCFLQLTRQRCSRVRLAQLGQRAENHFVGVPCGILDQGVSVFGRAGHAVWIDCTRLKFQPLRLPAGVQFRVFNTHTRHALVDGLYAQRHRECRQAAERLGVRVLADVTPAALDRHEHRLTAVQRARARHVVFEIARVQAAAKAMRAGDARSLGRLLLQSHASSRDLFENSTAELDFLVEKLTALPGVLGARLTGGGFGGAVMALTDSSFSPDAAARLQREYAARLGGRLESMALAAGGGATPVNPGAKA